MQVALYARVSTGSEEQASALEQQQARLKQAAAALGCTDPSWYVDIASGSRDDRPELARLLADCGAGLIGTVVVTRLDRLSRSSSHGAELLRYFQADTSPNLQALDDSLDLSSPGGRFMARLLISWAEAETDRLAERTRHGHAHRRALRKPFGSKAPFGYRFTADRSNLEPDPDTWPIAQELVARFLAEPITGTLVTWCHKEHGFTWGSNYSLRRWLCNPSLTGARVYGGQVQVVDPTTGRKRRKDRPPGEFAQVIPGCHPALLTPVQHARILAVYHARAVTHTRPLEDRQVRLLTGLLRCASCGRRLHYRESHTPGRYLYLRCQAPGCPERWRNSIREADALATLLSALILHAQELAAHLDARRAADHGRLTPDAAALKEQIATLEAMGDPDLAEAISRKRRQFDALVAATALDGMQSWVARVSKLQDPGLWLWAAEHDPALVRTLLQEGVTTAEVRQKRVAMVTVAPHLRKPGHDGVLCP